jgi:hypothetical protein
MTLTLFLVAFFSAFFGGFFIGHALRFIQRLAEDSTSV